MRTFISGLNTGKETYEIAVRVPNLAAKISAIINNAFKEFVKSIDADELLTTILGRLGEELAAEKMEDESEVGSGSRQ